MERAASTLKLPPARIFWHWSVAFFDERRRPHATRYCYTCVRFPASCVGPVSCMRVSLFLCCQLAGTTSVTASRPFHEIPQYSFAVDGYGFAVDWRRRLGIGSNRLKTAEHRSPVSRINGHELVMHGYLLRQRGSCAALTAGRGSNEPAASSVPVPQHYNRAPGAGEAELAHRAPKLMCVSNGGARRAMSMSQSETMHDSTVLRQARSAPHL